MRPMRVLWLGSAVSNDLSALQSWALLLLSHVATPAVPLVRHLYRSRFHWSHNARGGTDCPKGQVLAAPVVRALGGACSCTQQLAGLAVVLGKVQHVAGNTAELGQYKGAYHLQ
jgi:hypothetical protein